MSEMPPTGGAVGKLVVVAPSAAAQPGLDAVPPPG